VSEKVFPLRGGESMPKGRERLPGKKEEQDRLTKVASLAPLPNLIIRVLELVLKILWVI
jgi:hypothetical protein